MNITKTILLTILTAAGVLAQGVSQNGTFSATPPTVCKPGTIYQTPTAFYWNTSGAGTTCTLFSAGAASPLTTKGDLYTFSTVNARQPVGADGTVMTADSTQSTGVKWNTLAPIAPFTIALNSGNSFTATWTHSLGYFPVPLNCADSTTGAPNAIQPTWTTTTATFHGSTAQTFNCRASYSSAVGGGTGGSGTVFETRPLKISKVEPVSGVANPIAAAASVDLLNFTGTGSVNSLQFAVTNQAGSSADDTSYIDSLITITVDGTIVMAAPVGLVFATYGQQASFGAQPFLNENLGMTHYQPKTNMGGFRKLFIPFATSIRIQYTNGGASAVAVYSQAQYYVGAVPTGLMPASYSTFHAVYVPLTAVAAYASQTLLSVSGSGQLDSIQQFILGANTAPYWLEGNPTLTIDGSAQSYGGTEDFYGGQYYWNQLINRTKDWGVTSLGLNSFDSNYYTGMYRFFGSANPIVFGSTLTYVWINGQVNQPAGGPNPGTVQSAALIIWYS